MHLVYPSELPTQETGNHIAHNRSVKTWKMQVLRTAAVPGCQIFRHPSHLSGLPRTVKALYYYKHDFLFDETLQK